MFNFSCSLKEIIHKYWVQYKEKLNVRKKKSIHFSRRQLLVWCRYWEPIGHRDLGRVLPKVLIVPEIKKKNIKKMSFITQIQLDKFYLPALSVYAIAVERNCVSKMTC